MPTDEQVEAAALAIATRSGYKEPLPHHTTDARAALTAAGVKPRVKPLVWCEANHNNPDTVLDLPFGYFINETESGWRFNYTSKDYFPTMEQAKDAAQADYECSILSALEGGA